MTTTLNATTSNGLVVTPDNSGNVLLQYNGVAAPAFSAYRATTQSLSSGVWTKIQFNTEDFDTASCYDSSTNYRFTPTVAGYYQISAGWQNNANSSYNYCAIYKNGSIYRINASNGANGSGSTLSVLIYFNGSTDYAEGYAFTDAGAIAGTSANTIFTGCLLRGA
jgi:hypothetical protein